MWRGQRVNLKYYKIKCYRAYNEQVPQVCSNTAACFLPWFSRPKLGKAIRSQINGFDRLSIWGGGMGRG